MGHRMTDEELAVLGEQDRCKEMALTGKAPEHPLSDVRGSET